MSKENTRQASKEMEEEGWEQATPHPPPLRQEIDRSAASQTNKCLVVVTPLTTPADEEFLGSSTHPLPC